MMKIGLGFVVVSSTLLLVSALEAQTATPTQDSLADYARKVHKDTGGAKAKPKVFDNDNLPKDDKLSVVGQQAPAQVKPTDTDASEKPAAADGKASEVKTAVAKPSDAPAASSSEDDKAKKEAEWKASQTKIAAQKDQVSMLSRELDVTQREYQLRAAAMYADVGNRLRNSAQWDKEEASYKQQIADKQKALDEAKQKLEDMKDEALKAGVPSSMID
jgi:predicted component of type VI protein secretion system